MIECAQCKMWDKAAKDAGYESGICNDCFTKNCVPFTDSYKPLYEEFGCSSPCSFFTSEGLKRMEPGKSYDKNLNEI